MSYADILRRQNEEDERRAMLEMLAAEGPSSPEAMQNAQGISSDPTIKKEGLRQAIMGMVAPDIDEQRGLIARDTLAGTADAKKLWDDQTRGGYGISGFIKDKWVNRKSQDPKKEALVKARIADRRDATELGTTQALKKARMALAGKDYTALTEQEEQLRGFENTAENTELANIRDDAHRDKAIEYFNDRGQSMFVQQKGDGSMVNAETGQPQSLKGWSQRYPEEAVKSGRARAKMGGLLDTLSNLYMGLNDMGAAVSTTQSGPENILNFARSSIPVLERAVGSEAASIRNQIDSTRPLIIQEIRQASEMGVRGMDTKAEMDFYLQAMGDDTRDVQANIAAVIALNLAYGMDGENGVALAKAHKAELDKLQAEFRRERDEKNKRPQTPKYKGFSVVKS